MIDKKEDFDPYLNELFMIKLEGEIDFNLELVEVKEKNTTQTICFTLLFKGEKNRVLSQGIYSLVHKIMGEKTVFLTPVMVPKDDGIYYESVFNCLIEQ